ncbi:MAG: purine-nucleoside phosphorylase [Candidatus Eisenbacteria sp.]|nr:purine-nucleoside phosphorylase [Candidatus Eisenbacteria bacterium]
MSIHRDLRICDLAIGSDSGLSGRVRETAEYLKDAVSPFPEIAVVLGSGLGDWVKELPAEAVIPYGEIPHFPRPSVSGHGGSLIVLNLGGRRVAVLAGRVHLYEGIAAEEVVFPVRSLAAAGVRFLITTNAAGGLNPSLRVGDFLLVRDHLGFLPRQWSRGLGWDPDGRGVWGYDRRMGDHLERTAALLGIRMLGGVLFWFSGPTYETPAEARMVQTLGADAATMSTLPENIAAWSAGVRSTAISLITNHVVPDEAGHTRHSEVVDVARRSGENLRRLLEEALASWSKGVE